MSSKQANLGQLDSGLPVTNKVMVPLEGRFSEIQPLLSAPP